MLLRLVCLTVTAVLSLLRLVSIGDRDKDIEILVLRHQLTGLQRQVKKPAFTRDDRFLLAALLHRLPKDRPRHLRLLIRPDTILRRHRDLLRRRHATRRVRILHVGQWVTQLGRNLVMDLQDAVRDRDAKFTAAFAWPDD
ncbi:hypothetical protein [Nonomuraea sp. CA-141351]|uniref:hypothetical protein n=1 Tax=Nonomuraea sp. CA-141351 TaxID=3239996 RepID=UPI003D9181DA